jgi:hypothetical protein
MILKMKQNFEIPTSVSPIVIFIMYNLVPTLESFEIINI